MPLQFASEGVMLLSESSRHLKLVFHEPRFSSWPNEYHELSSRRFVEELKGHFQIG